MKIQLLLILLLITTASAGTFTCVCNDTAEEQTLNIEENPFGETSDTTLYIIIAVIAILILIFLVLIAKVSRRKPHEN